MEELGRLKKEREINKRLFKLINHIYNENEVQILVRDFNGNFFSRECVSCFR